MFPFKKLVRSKPSAARRKSKRYNTMPWGRSRMTATPKHFVGAFAPFPRSTWIHAHVPQDNYDRICKKIWIQAIEAEEEFASGASSPEREKNKESRIPDNKPSRHRAKEQQKEADDFGPSTRYEEDTQQYHTAFTLPCPRLSGHRPPHVAEPAQELKPVMEKEMKRAEGPRGNTNLSRREEDSADGQTSVSNYVKGILVPGSTSRENNQSAEPQPQPSAPTPVSSATADRTLRPQGDEDPQRARCESEDVENTSNSCDSDSSADDDDDFVSLPGERSCGPDNSCGESESENDSDGEMNEIPHLLDGSTSNCEQDSLYSCAEEDFPPLSTTKAPASEKMHSDWEIPLSFRPHDFPAATLASCVTARAHAPVPGKAEAPEAKSLSNAPAPAAASAAAAPKEQAYDLLADFPALQPSKKPPAPGVWREGNPQSKVAQGNRGHARTNIRCQERGGSRRRKVKIVPLEVFSICTRDQKSVGTSPTVNNQPPPGGTDGAYTGARSWASAAKVGLEQAAAPQEKARPRTLQQIVTINRAKVQGKG